MFAGEQRDSETGLDYLRARYYDPLVGRFVSADAYEGTLNDPMSLHDYQYAHANPVVNTDPSGYFSIGELLGTMAGYSVLAGLSYTTGSAVAELVGGGSVWDAVAKYDQFFAGFADAVTVGISTQVRQLLHGETATRNHKGLFFNLGRLGGAVASMWIGSYGTTFAKFGSANWVARAALGYDLFGAGVGMAQSTQNIMEGRATWWDALAFLPFLTWFNINYKLSTKGLSYGSNGGNLNIIPKGEELIPKKKIALGLGKVGQHSNPSLLEKFSHKVDAPYYAQWPGYFDVPPAPNLLGNFILENMQKADEIHFNLDSWNLKRYQKRYVNPKAYKQRGNVPLTELTWFELNNDHITNWEYHLIINSPELLDKTIFYKQGGEIIRHDELFIN